MILFSRKRLKVYLERYMNLCAQRREMVSTVKLSKLKSQTNERYSIRFHNTVEHNQAELKVKIVIQIINIYYCYHIQIELKNAK